MASGKRASMREGPLAALFRKTEEEGLHGEGVPQSEQPRQPEPREPQGRREPEPRREFRPPAEEPELRPAPPSARRSTPSETAEDGEERRGRRAARGPDQRVREGVPPELPEYVADLPPP